MPLLLRWILGAFSLLLVAYMLPGITVSGFGPALIAAAILGLLNAVVRPFLLILTLPVTLLTLGIFAFLVNATVFALAAFLVPGFTVTGFGAALLGATLVTILNMVLGKWVRYES